MEKRDKIQNNQSDERTLELLTEELKSSSERAEQMIDTAIEAAEKALTR